MKQFVGRADALAALNGEFSRDGASMFVLYGRRRLGKTTLLRRFCQGKMAVYHMADRSAEADARRLLAGSMAHALGEPTLAAVKYRDWYALFAAFDRFRPKGKTLLILDEYQYLCERQPAFSSCVQRWWDEHWQHESIMVILCGSVLSMMYRETLARSSPLFGRRSGQWLLRPMRFRDVTEFFPRRSPREVVEMWAMTGGVPWYAELASRHRTMAEALRRLALSKDGALYAEAKFLLQDEVTTANVYWSLLHAIGNGVGRISEIGGRLGLAANQLTRYLAALGDMGLVRREVSVTEANPGRSKRGVYGVTDFFLRLWFGCIAPYESLLEFGKITEAEALMKERLGAHIAWAFEEACRQHIEDRAAEYGIVKVGRYWDRNMEVDVVGCNRDGAVVLAGECKWSNKPLGMDVADGLVRKAAGTWPDRRDSVTLALFSAGGFTPQVLEWAKKSRCVRLIDLDAMVDQ
jgi:AAA+ ATPase superfamily predicted ATPase